ncbi:tyrosine-type recombinase/integrase [Azospirillum sp. B506]|uniref:tyrosine-type recombinase/integrase n=1 Tax=Azospirillum sp. B506 TaxID=137721 RepID=UPI0003452AAB|nr:tyrosine-type recombinase/integrase [Azospirillum sp. B506]
MVLPADRLEEVRALQQRRRDLVPLAFSAGTWKAYRSAWKSFTTWCASLGYEPLSGDVEVLSQYLTHLERRDPVTGRPVYKRSTIDVHWSAISVAHKHAGRPIDSRDPRLSLLLKAIRRSKRNEGVDDADPINLALLRALLRACPPGIVGLRVSDADVHHEYADGLYGVRFRIRSSKTDQEGLGSLAGVPDVDDPDLNPRAALEAWLEARTVMAGGRPLDREAPLFCALTKSGKPKATPLTGHVINALVQDLVAEVRRQVIADEAEQKRLGLFQKYDFSAHSLRAGMATEVAKSGVDTTELMQTGRWKSAQVASRYVKDRDAFGGAARVLGKVARR